MKCQTGQPFRVHVTSSSAVAHLRVHDFCEIIMYPLYAAVADKPVVSPLTFLHCGLLTGVASVGIARQLLPFALGPPLGHDQCRRQREATATKHARLQKETDIRVNTAGETAAAVRLDEVAGKHCEVVVGRDNPNICQPHSYSNPTRPYSTLHMSLHTRSHSHTLIHCWCAQPVRTKVRSPTRGRLRNALRWPSLVSGWRNSCPVVNWMRVPAWAKVREDVGRVDIPIGCEFFGALRTQPVRTWFSICRCDLYVGAPYATISDSSGIYLLLRPW